MKQESIKQIIHISSALGWRVVYVDHDDDGNIKPLIQPAAYFAAVREITCRAGWKYDHGFVPYEQDIEDVEEYVELHAEMDGFFDDPKIYSSFFKFLAPGEGGSGDSVKREMEAHFAEKERLRKAMEDEAARKKTEEPPRDGKGGEEAA